MKLLTLLFTFSLGIFTAYKLQLAPFSTRSAPSPAPSFGPGSLLSWGVVIVLLGVMAGLGIALIYWAFLKARTSGSTIHAKQGLFPLVSGKLAPGDRYIFDPNRTASPATVFNRQRGQVYFIDGGPEATRIVSQAQVAQALLASGGSLPGHQIVQALNPIPRTLEDDQFPLPPILPLPDSVSLSHLDSLVEKLDEN